jgi:hypothetical protein
MTYLSGRQAYQRPQAIIWSTDLDDVNSDGMFEPIGYEVGSSGGSDFLILSDHGRQDISFGVQRIEKRERMINGRMRSWHIADKRTLSVSWDMLPSRSFETYPHFDSSTGIPSVPLSEQYTADGGAGGMELFDWYQTHTSPFYVFLSYDKFDPKITTPSERLKTDRYPEVIEMYITDFSYNVVKRSGIGYDFWNVSVTLEEV